MIIITKWLSGKSWEYQSLLFELYDPLISFYFPPKFSWKKCYDFVKTPGYQNPTSDLNLNMKYICVTLLDIFRKKITLILKLSWLKSDNLYWILTTKRWLLLKFETVQSCTCTLDFNQFMPMKLYDQLFNTNQGLRRTSYRSTSSVDPHKLAATKNQTKNQSPWTSTLVTVSLRSSFIL